MCTGGAVCIMMMMSGHNVWVADAGGIYAAGMLAGLATGFFHTFMGIPAILSGILTQLALWSVNLEDDGQVQPGTECGQVQPARFSALHQGCPVF